MVIPVLPGYLGCAAGAVAFGSVAGFWCNYIGISAGSIIAFFLARKYGMDIVLTMFSEKQYKRWCRKIEKSRNYERFLLIAAVLPLFPDDFLCYFSGLVKMNSKKFIWIIILGKPWCILAYSIVFGLIKWTGKQKQAGPSLRCVGRADTELKTVSARTAHRTIC